MRSGSPPLQRWPRSLVPLEPCHGRGPRSAWTSRDAAALAPVVGRAALRVDLSTVEGHTTFNNLRVGTPDATAAFRCSSLSYAIDVQDNIFADAAGRVRGGFFGPAHEEMADTLDDRTPGVELLAGFGGSR